MDAIDLKSLQDSLGTVQLMVSIVIAALGALGTAIAWMWSQTKDLRKEGADLRQEWRGIVEATREASKFLREMNEDLQKDRATREQELASRHDLIEQQVTQIRQLTSANEDLARQIESLRAQAGPAVDNRIGAVLAMMSSSLGSQGTALRGLGASTAEIWLPPVERDSSWDALPDDVKFAAMERYLEKSGHLIAPPMDPGRRRAHQAE